MIATKIASLSSANRTTIKSLSGSMLSRETTSYIFGIWMIQAISMLHLSTQNLFPSFIRSLFILNLRSCFPNISGII